MSWQAFLIRLLGTSQIFFWELPVTDTIQMSLYNLSPLLNRIKRSAIKGILSPTCPIITAKVKQRPWRLGDLIEGYFVLTSQVDLLFSHPSSSSCYAYIISHLSKPSNQKF